MTDTANKVFCLLGSDDSEKLARAVSSAWPDAHRFPLPSGDWLVATRTQQPAIVYEQVKEAAGGDFSFLVVELERFYGWHDKAVWDWIEVVRSGRQ